MSRCASEEQTRDKVPTLPLFAGRNAKKDNEGATQTEMRERESEGRGWGNREDEVGVGPTPIYLQWH